ncbi:flavonoid 3'-monooxygenase CYP75B137 [Ricinus communis]|uniref:Cytochrome P450, putative n=1 Tax=Ricinus communis TaxID=3988 RepID=B9RBQ9_RICCO|nr:flavonoid 3'-monooxygenase CYP75B137 [Ricinus communis]EEF50980.1 cytochrome P450, putative [Ricinus communis]|eukprot:XP_002509593.1 flavonoid 3',5'-hydroxylase 1 [Ricinus communis]
MIFSFWSWWYDASNYREKYLIPVLATALTIISLLSFLFNVRKLKYSTPPLPPGPRGLPVFGYLPFLGTFLHKKFTDLAGEYGPIYKLWLGRKLCIVISSPSLAKEIVRDEDKIFANRDPPTASKIITYGGNDIVWSSYGPEWKKIRKVFVREMLSNASLEASYPMRKEEVQKTIRDLCNEVGKTVDFGQLVFEIAANASISMLCGSTLKGEKAISFVGEFRKWAEEIMVLQGKPNVSDLFPVLARFDLQGLERETRRIFLCIDQILDSVIEQCLNTDVATEEKAEKSESRKDFLQILLEFNKHGDAATSITTNQLKALLIDIVVGGTETTSTMLEWAMAELMLNQEVMKTVYQELDQVVGINNIVEEFHLPRLQFLDAVLKETFRLHPALPLLVPHFSSRSCRVGGYTIPKGSTIFLNAYAIHRDPLLWDNPLEFRPERFLSNDDNYSKFDYSGNNFQYLPFGSGRRVCAGLPLAERMQLYIFASLLHSFEWKLPLGTELELSDKFGIVVKKMKPLLLVAKPRLSTVEKY